MKLYKMIEIYLKCDNINTIRIINASICINNHVNSCINSMLSMSMSNHVAIGVETLVIDSGCSLEKEFTQLRRMNP